MTIKKEKFELDFSGLDRCKSKIEHTRQMLEIMAFAEKTRIEGGLIKQGETKEINCNEHPMLNALTSLRDLQDELIVFVNNFRSGLFQKTTISRRENLTGCDPTEFVLDPDNQPTLTNGG